MEAAEYEEGYFKLKKSNEELVTLLNKVISDLKLSKTWYKDEKDKNATLVASNGKLSAELIKVTSQCEEHNRTIANLTEELDYLKSYSKAVEGVAENYCGKSLHTQKKYDALKRQSSIFFSNCDQSLIEFDLVDNENDLDVCDTPTPILEIEEIKTSHSKIIKEEKQRYEKLRIDFTNAKNEIVELSNEIEELNEIINDKDKSITELHNDLDILVLSHKTLKDEHEEIMNYFEPFLKIKAENNDLKRTSALLLNSVAGDEKIMEFLKVVENLKSEITDKNNKISDLEVKLLETDQSTIMLDMTALKTELKELTAKMEILKKERDNLKHENRILLDQKVSFGIPAPPAPPPPPPPPSSSFMNIFKKNDNKKNTSCSPKKTNPKDVVISNLMLELEKKLLKIVKEKNISKTTTSPSAKNTDCTDHKINHFPVNLRKGSVPILTENQRKINELDEVFLKKAERLAGVSPFLQKSFDTTDSSISFVSLRKNSCPNPIAPINTTNNNELSKAFQQRLKTVPRISEEEKKGKVQEEDDQTGKKDEAKGNKK